MSGEAYGVEMLIDLHGVDNVLFTRPNLEEFMVRMCVVLEVTPEDLHFWDDQDLPEEECQKDPKTKGVTAVQFILQSNITVHCLDELGQVFINVFSCKGYEPRLVLRVCKMSFPPKSIRSHLVSRG